MMLTSRQSRMTGDTDPSLLPVHVNELTLQTAARRAEHLKNTQPQIKEKKEIICTAFLQRMSTLDEKHFSTWFYSNCESL